MRPRRSSRHGLAAPVELHREWLTGCQGDPHARREIRLPRLVGKPLALRLQFLLRHSQVVNVGVDPHPANERAGLVAKRVHAGQEPAKRAVPPPQWKQQLPRISGLDDALPLPDNLGQMPGVMHRLPAPSLHLFVGRAGVFVPPAIVVIDEAIRPGRPAELRHRFKQHAPKGLLGSQRERVRHDVGLDAGRLQSSSAYRSASATPPGSLVQRRRAPRSRR